MDEGVKSELDFTSAGIVRRDLLANHQNLQHQENGTMFKATTRKQTPTMFKPCLERLEDRITPSGLDGDLATLGQDALIGAYDLFVAPELPGGIGIVGSLALHGITLGIFANAAKSYNEHVQHSRRIL